MNYYLDSVAYRKRLLFNSFAAILLLLAPGCTEHKTAEVKNDIVRVVEKVVKRVENGTIYFADGSSTKTGLFNLKYITQLPTERGVPFIVASGTDCGDCDENISIWIFRADSVVGEKPRYTYPGKEQDYLDDHLLFSSRLFYGDCLGKQYLAWVQTDYSDSPSARSTIYTVQVKNDTLSEENVAYSDSMFAKLKKCNEVQGVDTKSEP